LIPQVNAAIKLVDEGVASIEDIDLACEKALGHPVGPLKLLDILGIDTAKMIWDGIIEHYPEMGMNRSKTLDRLVSQKKFGRKTGEGFYKYKSKI
jgi:3-hydroxyacyl-CoA dehydrogenase